MKIDAVAFGGDGIARHEGKVIFVPDSVPGEELLIEIETDKDRFARARIIERIAEADYKQPSPCPYAQRCGGCQWLEVPYAKQLAWKESFIAAALQRIARTTAPAAIKIQPSPQIFGFRNRIKLKLLHHPQGHFSIGYYAKASHDLVPIERCQVAVEPINAVLKSLQELRFVPPPQGASYELELQHLPADQDRVTAAFLPPVDAELREKFRRAAAELPELAERLIWAAPADAARLLEQDQGLSYLTQAGQFQQINLPANKQLRAWIKAKVLGLGVRRVLDLFCGSGNFSLQLAEAGIEVWGIELADQAIASAKANVAANRLQGARYERAMAHELFTRFPELQNGMRIELVIVDPPRKGMAEALPSLVALAAPHIIYISCDPNTLARDLKSLLQAQYQIRELMGLDFFPHTYHVETVVHLSRSDA